MFLFSEEMRGLSEDFKRDCLQFITEDQITREEIAGVLGVNHGTVSRWFSPGDFHFPACLVPALNTPKLKPLAEAMLRFQASKLGLSVSRRVCASKLDGSIQDESLDIVQHLGKAVAAVREGNKSIRCCRKELLGIIEASDAALQELEAMEKQS
jgi:hypothetical protein